MKTTKKQKFVGYKILVDPETGETYPMQMNVMEDRDFNFHKVWLQHLVNSLDSISNQKLRLAFWIIDHLDREDQLIMTQRAIADATNMSTKTVNTTLKPSVKLLKEVQLSCKESTQALIELILKSFSKVLTQTEWVFVTNTKKLTRNNKRRTKD